MKKLLFEVESSSSEQIYELSAYRTKEGVRFSCTCEAAENGVHCKHRLALLHGDVTNLTSGKPEDIEALRALFAETEIYTVLTMIEECENAMKTLKKRVSDLKKRTAILMMG